MAEDIMRPKSFDEYIGQPALKREIAIRIRAAQIGQRPFEHMLLEATPGAGKTSLAEIVGIELGEPTEVMTMPVTQRAILNVVRSFDGIFVIDEVHELNDKLQGWLQNLIEFNYLVDSAGRKTHAPGLTVIACTTRRQDIIKPLLDRFQVHPLWVDYTEDELCQIVHLMAGKIGIKLDPATALAFGRASLGTPRRARQFVLAYRDLLEGTDEIPTAQDALDLCHVEADGLSVHHVRYLQILDALGGVKGLKVIASLLRLDESVVQDLERILMVRGFITMGNEGRELSRAGFARARQTTETN